MVSKLIAIDPENAKQSKPKILIFGRPGVGKTWSSIDFPNVYFIDTEGGANQPKYIDKLKKSNGVYLGVEEGALSFQTIIEQIKALATEKHNYKTLVIDSITKVFATEISDEAEKLGDKNAFGADKKPAVGYMRKLVSRLTKLDMNVILIAHEKELWGLDDKGQRGSIGVTFDAWDKIAYELDLCMNIFKIAGTYKSRVTKSRIEGFDDAEVFEWSYSSFSEKYGKDIIESDVKQVIVATPEQLEKINSILIKIALPKEQIEKWFKKAKCESWEEMESDKLTKILEYIDKQFIQPMQIKENK